MIPLRIYAYIAAAVALLGGLAYGSTKVYRAGYDARVAEQSTQYQADVTQMAARAAADWEKSAARAADTFRSEQKLAETIRAHSLEIPKMADELGACRDLGPAFLRLFNDTVSAANGQEGHPDTAKPDGAVSDVRPSNE